MTTTHEDPGTTPTTPATSTTDRTPALALAAAGVTVVLWASAFVAIRHVGQEFSPGPLTLGRLLVGSLVLGTVVLVRGPKWPARRDWRLLLVCGLLWFGVYNIALNAAEQRVDAGTTAMLVNVGPLILALLAGVLLGEGFPPRLVVGSLIAFGGVAVIGAATSGRSAGTAGVLLCLVAAIGYAVGVVAQKPLLGAAPRARRHLAGVHRRCGRLPAVRPAARVGGRRRARLHAGLDRLPRGVPDRDRVHDLGVRAVAHDRRPDGRDDLPRATGDDPAGLADARRVTGRARFRGRRALPARRRRRPAYAQAAGPAGGAVVRAPSDGVSIARLAALLADATRAGMCLALLDGTRLDGR